jgi:tetratricopeptide (TPR) repeat protein
MSSEKYNEAIKAYEKANEIDPQDSSAWYKNGDALKKLNISFEELALTGLTFKELTFKELNLEKLTI